MKLLLLVGVPLCILILVFGIVLQATGRGDGVRLIVVGAILAVVWAVAIPVARRRGKV